MSITIALGVAATIAVILLLHKFARCVVALLLNVVQGIPSKVAASRAWTSSENLRPDLVTAIPCFSGLFSAELIHTDQLVCL